ncbi:MAG TPA: hypothetical protein VK508_14115 [Cyclobacteriaceae bacterium]|nr:hypothetical protein [Cyclobacteriaceae bacterium]
MIQKFLPLACLLLCVSSVFAQKDFRPGYIIKDRDTVKGLVAFRSKHNAEAGIFKPGKKDKAITYAPGEAIAYGFLGDKKYEAIDLGTIEVPKKIFALVLQKGAIDLYYTNQTYLLLKDNQLTVLQRKPDSIVTKTIYGERRPVFAADVSYVQALNNLIASDCGLNANAVLFSRNQISELIGDYNKCKNDYVEVKNFRPFVSIGASLAVGLYKSVLTLDTLPGYKFKGDVATVWQFDVEFTAPRLTDRIVVSLGLQPVRSTYRASTFVTSSVQTQQDDMTLKVRYFKIPLSVRYNFGSPKNSLFVRLAAWQGIFQKKDVRFTTIRTTRTGSAVHSSEDNVKNGYRNPAGITLGVGYDKAIVSRFRLFGEFRYEINSGFVGKDIHPFSAFNFMYVLVGVGI